MISNIFSRLVRRFRSSILLKVAGALFLFSLFTNGANIINLRYLAHRLFADYYAGQLDTKVRTLTELNLRNVRELNEYMLRMPKLYPNIPTTLSMNGELSYTRRIMQSEMGVKKYDGFVLGSADGKFKRTSYLTYPENTVAAVEDIFAYVSEVPDHKYVGFANVLGRGVGLVSACTLPDTTGAVGCYALIVHSIFENNEHMTDLSFLGQVNCSMLNGNVCTASVWGDAAVGQPITDPAIADTCQAGGSFYRIESRGDKFFYTIYTPIVDHRGRMLAILNASIDGTDSAYMTHMFILWTIIIAAIGGVIFYVLILLYFRGGLVNPIRALSQSAVRISSADLSQPVAIVHTGDEIQTLSENIANVQNSFANTVRRLATAAQHLHAQSQELSHASDMLSDGANKQAASLEEISSSLEEMTSNIHQNTDNAENTNRLVATADKAVADIADTAADNLVATRKIANIIRNINQLVGQTNILSLNASVEAARAGSMGRGFAVVAREVGRLAEQTKTTAQGVADTATLSIDGSQTINNLIEELVPQLHHCASLLNEITVASREQGIGADQISLAINSLNKVTQENAAGAEEIAAGAQQILTLVGQINDFVRSFKL